MQDNTSKTTNEFIKLNDKASYRTGKPKDKLIDQAQEACLAIRPEHGLNHPIQSDVLSAALAAVHLAKSTFFDNFGGFHGVVKISEASFYSRLKLTLQGKEEEGLEYAGTACYAAQFCSDSPYLPPFLRKTEINVARRTQFALEFFSDRFWVKLSKLFWPALVHDLPDLDKALPGVKKRLLRALAAELKLNLDDLSDEGTDRRKNVVYIFNSRIERHTDATLRVLKFKYRELLPDFQQFANWEQEADRDRAREASQKRA